MLVCLIARLCAFGSQRHTLHETHQAAERERERKRERESRSNERSISIFPRSNADRPSTAFVLAIPPPFVLSGNSFIRQQQQTAGASPDDAHAPSPFLKGPRVRATWRPKSCQIRNTTNKQKKHDREPTPVLLKGLCSPFSPVREMEGGERGRQGGRTGGMGRKTRGRKGAPEPTEARL